MSKEAHTQAGFLHDPSPFPDFHGALVFFDLAGTLLERDQPLFRQRAELLRDFASLAGQIVLVTGQSSEDPQVQAICQIFLGDDRNEFAAYVTRGGLRLVKCGKSLECDADYLADTRLEDELRETLLNQVEVVLGSSHLKTIIPVKCIDEVAIRVNLEPDDRLIFIKEFKRKLAKLAIPTRQNLVDLDRLQVVAEGRTSVFIMRPGVGKKKAVNYELQKFAERVPYLQAYYFGNEFQEGGNDREILEIPGINAMVLNGCNAPPPQTIVRDIGRTPDDLHTFLRCSSAVLPVVFVSLGGTKIGVGALTANERYIGEKELYWRTTDNFSACIKHSDAKQFCTALVKEVDRFLKKSEFTWTDVGMLGMGFPGPCVDDRCYSNNLTLAFQEGVPLTQYTAQAIKSLAGQSITVRVAFDAQCDAGGEVYHPRGRLRPTFGPVTEATVLNIATGIAGAFVKDGRVLVRDTDFQTHVGSDYDGGAGQIGRHLWYHTLEEDWMYHYLPRGATPCVTGAVRMTEYLSGPALAGRLLLRLTEADSVPHADNWTLRPEDLERIQSISASLSADIDLTRLSQQVRQQGQFVSTAILTWADEVYQNDQPADAAQCVRDFAEQVAKDLSAALTAWSSVSAWEPYLKRVVLTGGVGIRFLASSDESDKCFLSMLRSRLDSKIHVDRSRLHDGIERGVYLFVHQPIY